MRVNNDCLLLYIFPKFVKNISTHNFEAPGRSAIIFSVNKTSFQSPRSDVCILMSNTVTSLIEVYLAMGKESKAVKLFNTY